MIPLALMQKSQSLSVMKRKRSRDSKGSRGEQVTAGRPDVKPTQSTVNRTHERTHTVQTREEHLETPSMPPPAPAGSRPGGPSGDSSRAQGLREESGGAALTGADAIRPAMLTNRGAATWKCCFLHQTQCGRPISPQPPWEPEMGAKHEGKFGTVKPEKSCFTVLLLFFFSASPMRD